MKSHEYEQTDREAVIHSRARKSDQISAADYDYLTFGTTRHDTTRRHDESTRHGDRIITFSLTFGKQMQRRRVRFARAPSHCPRANNGSDRIGLINPKAYVHNRLRVPRGRPDQRLRFATLRFLRINSQTRRVAA